MTRVLFVEDDPSILLGVSMILREDGFIVDGVSSAPEAYSHAERHQPDIAVVDFRLDGTRGVEVVERLRRQKPELPAVLITGMVDATELSEDANRLHLALLQKPFEVQQLTELIETMTDGSPRKS